jgi:two-component sensor histidine kinase
VADVIFAPYRAEGEHRIIAKGPKLTITKEAGTTLALCLHELATNALKYGALSGPAGRIELRWTLSGPASKTLTIDWLETGGPAVGEPTHSGYGTGYIRAALTSLTGQAPVIEFLSWGLHCRVKGPVARVLWAAQRPGEFIDDA